MIKLNESNSTTTVTLEIMDCDHQIIDLLNHIKEVSSSGHSFNVVTDPDTEDEQSFFIDGDGACQITNIKVDDKISESEELPLNQDIVQDDNSSVVTPTGIKSDNDLVEDLITRLRS